jgi:hypothetical protein
LVEELQKLGFDLADHKDLRQYHDKVYKIRTEIMMFRLKVNEENVKFEKHSGAFWNSQNLLGWIVCSDPEKFRPISLTSCLSKLTKG